MSAVHDIHAETVADALAGISAISRALAESQVNAELDGAAPLSPSITGGLHDALHCLAVLAESRLEFLGGEDDG
jgi:hypothetical protein